MNNDRRKQLREIITVLENVKVDLEAIRDDEQDYMDNIPENLQGSSRCDTAEEAIDNMDDALNYLEDVMDFISEAI